MRKIILVISALVLLSCNEHFGMLYGQNAQWFHYGLFKTNCMVFFNGEMLVGTTEGIFAIDQQDYSTGKKYIIDDTSNVVDFYKVGNDRLWCLTTNRLYLIEKHSIKRYPLPENVSKSGEVFNQICEAYNNKLYLGTKSGFFKGDSSRMNFCSSRSLVSKTLGVKEILSHNSGKVIIHFGEALKTNQYSNSIRSGMFLLIEEEADKKKLKIINNVLFVTIDSKANLYIVSVPANSLAFDNDAQVFDGKKLLVHPVSAKLGDTPNFNSMPHAINKINPVYRLVSRKGCDHPFYIDFIDMKKNDELYKSETGYGCGGSVVTHERMVMDNKNQSWFSSERPLIRIFDSSGNRTDVILTTKNPYFSNPPVFDDKRTSQMFFARGVEEQYYTEGCFIGRKSRQGWTLHDFEDHQGFVDINTNKYGKTFALSGVPSTCAGFVGIYSIVDLKRIESADAIIRDVGYYNFDRNEVLSSLLLKNGFYNQYGGNREQDLMLAEYDGNQKRQISQIMLSGNLIFFEEVFNGQLVVVTQLGIFKYELGKWNDLSNRLPKGIDKIFKATFIPDKKIVLATDIGLVEFQSDFTAKVIKYPKEAGKVEYTYLLEFGADGILWFSSKNNLFKLEESRWVIHDHEINISYFAPRIDFSESSYLKIEKPHTSFVSDVDHGTFISSLGGTYQYYDGKWRLISPSIFGYLVFDEKGNLMIFHSKGVSLYNLKGVK